MSGVADSSIGHSWLLVADVQSIGKVNMLPPRVYIFGIGNVSRSGCEKKMIKIWSPT